MEQLVLYRGVEYRAVLRLPDDYVVGQLLSLEIDIVDSSGTRLVFKKSDGITLPTAYGLISTANPRIFILHLSAAETGSLTAGAAQWRVRLSDDNLGLLHSDTEDLTVIKPAESLIPVHHDFINLSIADLRLKTAVTILFFPQRKEAAYGVVGVPVVDVTDGQVIAHDYGLNLKIFGFYNVTSDEMEIPTSFKSTNVSTAGFTLNAGFSAEFSETLINGILICLVV